MWRRRSDLVAASLSVLISLPAFAVGHRLRKGDASTPVLALMVLVVVAVASALMKQLEG